jgi:two-component system NtrC family sensor kinase
MRSFGKVTNSKKSSCSVAGAALQAASREELLEQVANSLLEETQADRVGVWVEGVGSDRTLRGLVRDRGGSLTPHEWAQLSLGLPFLQQVYLRGQALEQMLEETQEKALIGPLVEMRQAVWVPARRGEHTFGVLLAATRQHREGFSAAALEPVAAELTLALEAECERFARTERDADLTFSRETLRQILQGTPPNTLLDSIADNCVQQVGAGFTAIGRRSGSDMGFPWKSGTADWSKFLEHKDLLGLCQKAMQEGRVIVTDSCGWELGHGADATWPEAVVRIVIVPLIGPGKQLGVFLAGLRGTQESLPTLERLELRATLAAATLAGDAAHESGRAEATRLEAWLAATPETVLVLDQEGIIQEASQGARELLNLEASRLGRAHLEDLFTQGTGADIAVWNAAAASQDLQALKQGAQGVLADGRRMRLTAEPAAMPGSDRRRIRVHAEKGPENGQRAEAELRTVIEWLDQGVVLFDTHGFVRVANSRFSQVMGLAPGEMDNLTTLDALARRLAEQMANPGDFAHRWKEEVLSGEAGARDEIPLLRPVPRVLERFGRPVYGPQGRRIGWLELYRDLTPQRVFQSKLMRTEKLVSLGQMVTSVAHELGNLLTTISGYTQRLLAHPGGAHVKGDLSRILREADRASRMIRNVLLTARDTQPERHPVNLNEIIDRAIELRLYELELDNIRVETHLAGDLPPVLGNADQLQQVVTNLLVNAEQAIQEGRGRGTIRISSSSIDGPAVRLEVADDGPGVPTALLARIFDPFFTTKPAGVGTGLGLSIVHSIVREHGGQIRVMNVPAGGALFVVEFPAALRDKHSTQEKTQVVPRAQPEARPEASDDAAAPAYRGRSRVLVVEDEPTVAGLITDVLREEGLEVLSLLDSRKALEQAVQGGFDLVVCDLKMPDLDGKRFYESLVHAGSPLRQRIIFVTGDTLTPHTLAFLQEYRLPYVAKPFRVEELRHAVGRILNRARAQAAGGGRTREMADTHTRKT